MNLRGFETLEELIVDCAFRKLQGRPFTFEGFLQICHGLNRAKVLEALYSLIDQNRIRQLSDTTYQAVMTTQLRGGYS